MTEPTTEAQTVLVAAITRYANEDIFREGEPVNAAIRAYRAAIEAEARADLARRIEARVEGWLSDPMWPQFGPGIGVGPFDAGHMAARAAAEQVLDVVRDEAAK